MHVQSSTQAEEERLGVDFATVWQQRQRATVLQAVEPFMAPVANAQELHFKHRYSQPCASLCIH